MTERILLGTLQKHGLEKIDPLGQQFDPNKHEATFQVPMPDKEPNSVFVVQQTGFVLNGRTIRVRISLPRAVCMYTDAEYRLPKSESWRARNRVWWGGEGREGRVVVSNAGSDSIRFFTVTFLQLGVLFFFSISFFLLSSTTVHVV